MSTSADRLEAVTPFVAKYATKCPKISTAKNIPQGVDLLTRQRIFDSGGRLSYRQALEDLFASDRELAKAYTQS